VRTERPGSAVCGHGLLAEHRPDLPVVAPAAFFRDVTNDMRITLEDIFGPVLVVIPYEDDDEAIAIANDSAYGLDQCRPVQPQRAGVDEDFTRTGTGAVISSSRRTSGPPVS
jgi:aldehyde dehydrogenase (NAD+)